MRKGEDIVALIFGVVLILIILGILVVLAKQQNTSGTSSVVPSNAPAIATQIPTPTTTDTKSSGYYNERAEDKLMDAIKNRQPLTTTDAIAKANILTLLPADQQSGILYNNSQFSIEYIHSADLFQVEILTTDIKAAKDAANLWFRSHGLSQEAICKLPVEFYLNYDIMSQLRGKSVNFSPLANGC